MLRTKVNSLGNPCDQSWRRKEGYGGKDLQKSWPKVLSTAFNYGSLCDTERDAILTCDQKPTWVRFIYSRETTTKKWRTGRLKSKYGYAQKYRYTVRGIRGVNPEEEKVGYGGKDLRKRKVLSLVWKSEGVMDRGLMKVVSQWNWWRKCHSKNWVRQNWRD